MTTVRRKIAFNPVETFREHLVLKSDASKIAKRSDALKTRLKEWLPKAVEGHKNEQGSVFVDLPETLVVDGTAYSGMELRRSVSTRFNEDVAEEVVKAKDLWEEATTRHIDQDKVYRLVQEKRITEAELDSMLSESETFSFWPVKGEVLD